MSGNTWMVFVSLATMVRMQGKGSELGTLRKVIEAEESVTRKADKFLRI